MASLSFNQVTVMCKACSYALLIYLLYMLAWKGVCPKPLESPSLRPWPKGKYFYALFLTSCLNHASLSGAIFAVHYSGDQTFEVSN